MAENVKTFEVAGVIDEQHQLHLDDPLPITGPKRVRVRIFVPEHADIDDTEWLRAAAVNPAFDFLSNPEEDVYTLADGKPFNDQK